MNAGRFWPTCLRAAAIGTLIVYCLWWVYWLAHGKLAPALFLAITGLPAPTTGMGRALHALVNGHWRASVAFNALTIPILGLTGVSLGHVALQLSRRRTLALPPWIVRSWAVVLILAWILKLAGPRQYW